MITRLFPFLLATLTGFYAFPQEPGTPISSSATPLSQSRITAVPATPSALPPVISIPQPSLAAVPATRSFTRPAAAFPSPEEFVNAVVTTVVDSSFTHYYLVKGADTCRFVKYDYDEWIKYHLRESVPLNVLNELSEKAYLSRYPYFWKQDRLQRALCITSRQADSVFSLANPALEKDGPGSKQKKETRQQKENRQKELQQWQALPVQEKLVFSFSLPQFTDDGQYAVIDLNMICGNACGASFTCLFRHMSDGWRLIGKNTNYSSLTSPS